MSSSPGVAWALLLLVPGWLVAPRALERRLVATVYHDIAAALRAIATNEAAAAQRTLTASLNAAYDALLTVRSSSNGRMRQGTHLVAILNASHPMSEAAIALQAAGERPPSQVTDTIDRLADVIAERPETGDLPVLPPQWSGSPGALALRESMLGLCRVISGNWTRLFRPAPVPALARAGWPGGPAARLPAPPVGQRHGGPAHRRLDRVDVHDPADVLHGRRLRAERGAAAAAVVLGAADRRGRPQARLRLGVRPGVAAGRGTVLGAVLGTAILAVVPLGPWLLLPFGILAALLPYGKVKNYGLSATFFTPFVVLLIDLLDRTGWRLAADRAIDTVLGALVVLLVGYAPWPVSWHAHLPGKLAATLRVVCDYMDESLVTVWAARQPEQERQPDQPQRPKGGQLPRRSRLRRQSYRALSDLRAEYQRTMSEPWSSAAAPRSCGPPSSRWKS